MDTAPLYDGIQRSNTNTSTTFQKQSPFAYSTYASKTVDGKDNFRSNMTFLVIFSIIVNCGGFMIGHVLSCTNQTNTTFIAKFPEYAANETLYSSLVGASGVLGMTLGAISGGKIVKFGRRQAFLIATFIGFIGCSIGIIELIPTIIVGRLIYGYACGLYSTVVPRYIEEVVPNHLIQIFNPIFSWSQGLGTLCSTIMGEGLPDDEDQEALKDSGFWRVIIGIPLILLVICGFGMIFYVKYDSPKFLIFSKQPSRARKMIAQIYKKENVFLIYDCIEKSSQKETQQVSFKAALFNPQYRKATWVTIVLIIFHELTGINAIQLYSNKMFHQMATHGGTITPREGTYMVGIGNFLALVAAVFIIRKTSRRGLLIPGHILMAICHILVGTFAVLNVDGGVIAMVVCFIIVYQITNGPVIWLYSSEVVVDTALGLCIFVLWFVVLILSLTTNFLMQSALQPQGVFWLFGGISVIGAVFCYFFIRETRGLNDKERKILYTPEKYLCQNSVITQ